MDRDERVSEGGTGGGDRRRGGGGVVSLSSGEGGVARLSPAGEERAHGGQHLACGGERADLLRLLVDHEHAALFGFALSGLGCGGGLSDELSCHRLAPARAHGGADGGVPARGGDGAASGDGSGDPGTGGDPGALSVSGNARSGRGAL